MQRASRPVRSRIALRRACELAAYQSSDRARASERDARRHAKARAAQARRDSAAGSRDMSTVEREIQGALNRRYDAGFVTDIESESLPPGLNEDVVRAISARKQ